MGAIINIVWMLLIVLGFISSLIFGNLEHSTQSALEGAKDAVELCIGLAGVYALWLGLMKVAERSGLVELISKRIRRVMSLLFPGVPPGHRAMGAMTMNIIANMWALKCGYPGQRYELQSINRHKMATQICMFLINTVCSRYQRLCPQCYRFKNPLEIIGTAL